MFGRKKETHDKAAASVLNHAAEMADQYMPFFADKVGLDANNSRSKILLISAVLRQELGGFDGDEEEQLQAMFEFVVREATHDYKLLQPEMVSAAKTMADAALQDLKIDRN